MNEAPFNKNRVTGVDAQASVVVQGAFGIFRIFRKVKFPFVTEFYNFPVPIDRFQNRNVSDVTEMRSNV